MNPRTSEEFQNANDNTQCESHIVHCVAVHYVMSLVKSSAGLRGSSNLFLWKQPLQVHCGEADTRKFFFKYGFSQDVLGFFVLFFFAELNLIDIL